MNKLNYEYTSPTELVIGTKYPTAFRIQASSISSFFDYTANWYREKLLKLSEGFKGNESSVLGTCVHYIAQQYATNKQITQEDYTEIQNYISEQAAIVQLNQAEIIKQFPIMGQVVVNYLHKNPATIAEAFTEYEILPGITVGGSIDNITSNEGYSAEDVLNGKGTVTIKDYKTVNAITPPTAFTKGYSFQLLVYAWVLHQYGITATTMELLYITRDNCGRISDVTNKPMKDYPSQITSVKQAITAEDLEFIGSLIHLVAESTQAFIANPSLRYLLAQDYRLKGDTTPLASTTTTIEV